MNLTGKYFGMQRGLALVFLIVVLNLLNGCGKSTFFPDDPASVDHTLPAFTDIHVNSIFDVELKNDSVYSIRIEGDKGLIENISFDVVADSLILSDNNSFSWLPDYPRSKLIIGVPELRRIWINSPSFVYSTDTLSLTRFSVFSVGLVAEVDLTLKANNLYFTTDYNNFGYYILRGAVHEADIRTYGSVQLDAKELSINNANVRNYSTGDSFVRVENRLRAWLGHYGNIYYSGSPDNIVIEYMESRGRLINLYPD